MKHSLDTIAFAEGLRADRDNALELSQKAETDFDKGFLEGFGLALHSVLRICERSVLIDKAAADQLKDLAGVGKVLPLKRKKTSTGDDMPPEGNKAS